MVHDWRQGFDIRVTLDPHMMAVRKYERGGFMVGGNVQQTSSCQTSPHGGYASGLDGPSH